ncbi:hypothetical protein [Flavobacterium taihuense]|jgi:hypothetical protein|uniref:2TM domain-containing protein n=1 Tax=Flavobacterium taihuense TaxID=2857508 RepID=A0ABS6Y1M6_9FLAO|nr:hypothetical protein [Flavobacterium taihuense]MBW4362830.1 hypothetical protein [Flavobacterium taihuense]
MGDFNSEFKIQQKKLKPKVVLLIKRFYVIAFNIYAWFWLYREIFIRESTNFEDYLLWFFTTAGMYYFVLDSNDILLKIPKKTNRTE